MDNQSSTRSLSGSVNEISPDVGLLSDSITDSIRRQFRKHSANEFPASELRDDDHDADREAIVRLLGGHENHESDSDGPTESDGNSYISHRKHQLTRTSRGDNILLNPESITFMRPYLHDRKENEKTPVFVTLSFFPNGTSRYASLTLRDLLGYMQHEINIRDLVLHDSDETSAVADIKYRDIRRLESILTAHEEPAILVRRHCALMLLDPVRAIVLSDRMIVVIPDGADSMISILTNILQNQRADATLVDQQSPVDNNNSELAIAFEIKAFEAILDAVVTIHSQEFHRYSKKIKEALDKLKSRSIVPVKLQEKIRNLKNGLSSIAARISAHRRALDEILEEDEEMALLNLSKLAAKPSLYNVPLSHEIFALHEDMEVLIDSNLIDIISLETEVNLLRQEIQSAEESVMLRLDTSRNQLLIANTQIAVCSGAVACGGFIGSAFGMNLYNHHENDEWLWYYISGLSGAIMLLVICVSFYVLRRSGIIPTEK